MKYAYDSFPVTDWQIATIKEIREKFSILSHFLTENTPKGRSTRLGAWSRKGAMSEKERMYEYAKKHGGKCN